MGSSPDVLVADCGYRSAQEHLQAVRHGVSRNVSIFCLLRSPGSSVFRSETGETAVIDHFAWIPNHVLTSYNTSDRYIQYACRVCRVCLITANMSYRSQIEANTAQYLLPLPSRLEEESAWVDRFLNVLGSLSEKGKAILWRISRISDRRPSIWSKYLEACIKFNVRYSGL